MAGLIPEPPPHDWSQEYVGRYLQSWAMAEGALDHALHSALGLKLLQGSIVTAEMYVSSKIKIVIAAVHALSLPASQKKRYVDCLKRFLECTDERNMVAHCFFIISDSAERVEFYRYKLPTGPMKVYSVSWSENDFKGKFSTLDNIRIALSELPDLARKVKLAEILNDPAYVGSPPYLPSEGSALRGLSGLVWPLSPEGNSSPDNDAIPQTGEQTPPSPRETEEG